MEALPTCRPPKTAENGDHSDNTTATHTPWNNTVLHVNSSQIIGQAYYMLSSTIAPNLVVTSSATPVTSAQTHLGWFESILLCLCIIGVSGNILNLLVLTRRRFCSSLNKLESSANYGLIALAVSDLCFCLVVLPHVFLSNG